MSIQSALDFIRAVERQPALKENIRQVFADEGLPGIVQIGTDRQFIFTEPELRSAFGIDWVMRVFHVASRPDKS